MIKIGLILHSAASDNLGVGALTVAEVELLRGIAKRLGVEVKIRVFDWKLNRIPYVFGTDLELKQLNRQTLLSPKGYMAWVKECDLLIDIGAGDSFTDIYGAKRLRRVLWMKYMAHLARRPLILAPQTIGPFKKRTSRAAAKLTLRRSAMIWARDKESAELAQALHPGAEVGLASDLALRLPYAPNARRPRSSRPQIGINISGLLMAGGYDKSDAFGLSIDYAQFNRDLLARLLAHRETPEIHLIPHVAAMKGSRRSIGVEDDRAAALEFAKEFKDILIAPEFTTPSDAKSYIARLDFFVGARMHACIAAFSSGVPVVPLAYSRKFDGLFGSLEYRRTIDCRTTAASEALEQVIDAFDQRAAVKKEALAARELGLSRLMLYEQAVENQMRLLIGKTR